MSNRLDFLLYLRSCAQAVMSDLDEMIAEERGAPEKAPRPRAHRHLHSLAWLPIIGGALAAVADAVAKQKAAAASTLALTGTAATVTVGAIVLQPDVSRHPTIGAKPEAVVATEYFTTPARAPLPIHSPSWADDDAAATARAKVPATRRPSTSRPPVRPPVTDPPSVTDLPTATPPADAADTSVSPAPSPAPCPADVVSAADAGLTCPAR